MNKNLKGFPRFSVLSAVLGCFLLTNCAQVVSYDYEAYLPRSADAARNMDASSVVDLGSPRQAIDLQSSTMPDAAGYLCVGNSCGKNRTYCQAFGANESCIYTSDTANCFCGVRCNPACSGDKTCRETVEGQGNYQCK
jgi:hypothetical protein